MTDNAFILGYPVEFKNLCMIYPPKIKDVVTSKNYNIYIKLFTISQEEIEDEFIKQNIDLSQLLNPFEYLLNNAYNNQQMRELIEGAFLFFTHEPVTFLFESKKIIIGDFKDTKSVNDLRILTEDIYFDFQNMVRQAIGSKIIDPPNPDEDPRIKRIKAKARYRDYIKSKSKQALNLTTLLSSICCMNMGLNPLNIGELSYAAVPVLISIYQEKEKYETDVDSLLAGADSSKVKPKYWIRNLDK